MTMFPGAHASIIYNEEGEVLGWDYPSEPDPYDAYDDDRDPRYFDDEEEEDPDDS